MAYFIDIRQDSTKFYLNPAAQKITNSVDKPFDNSYNRGANLQGLGAWWNFLNPPAAQPEKNLKSMFQASLQQIWNSSDVWEVKQKKVLAKIDEYVSMALEAQKSDAPKSGFSGMLREYSGLIQSFAILGLIVGGIYFGIKYGKK